MFAKIEVMRGHLLYLLIVLLCGSNATWTPSDTFIEFISSAHVSCPVLGKSDLPNTTGHCTNGRLPIPRPNRTVSSVTTTSTSTTTNATIDIEDGTKTQDLSSGGGPKQPIVTFDEWTKEKLRQEQRRAEQLIVSAPPGGAAATPLSQTQGTAASRNYASRECGAKVLTANPEAENIKALLNDKEKDEYMRNPCKDAAQKYVIIELCETIQPHTIEMGNFELFSSGPRAIRVSATERFPTAEWTPILEAEAQDTRTLQTFRVNKLGLYAKFLKVELLSHYGREHYCTLTMLRVLGMSIVDEYEAEAEIAAGRIAVNSAPSTQAATTPPASPSSQGADSPLKDPSQRFDDRKEGSTPEPEKKNDEKAAQKNDKKEEAVAQKPTSVDPGNESQSTAGRILKSLVNVVIEKFAPDRGRKIGVTSWVHVCNTCPVNGTVSARTRHFCSLIGIPPKPAGLRSRQANRQSLFEWTSRMRYRRIRRSFLQRYLIALTSKEQEAPPRPSKPISSASTRIENTENVKTDPSKATTEQCSDGTLEPNSGCPGGSHGGAPPPEASIPIDAPTMAPVTTSTYPQQPPPPMDKIAEPLPAPSSSHKESVFMKLNKRIAALELNMSLSSEYLSELSRQYVAQAELQEQNIARAKRVAEDAVTNATSHINVTLSSQLESMRREVEQLAAFLGRMRRESVSLQLRIGSKEFNEQEQCEETEDDEENGISHYYSNDAIWTTEQVVYVAVAVQLVTVLTVLGIQWCFRSPPPVEILTEADVERIVDRKLRDLLLVKEENVSTACVSGGAAEAATSTGTAAKRRRRRKKQRKGDSDSAVDSSVPTPSATLSDAGSDSDRHSGSLDLTLTICPPDGDQPTSSVYVQPIPA